MTSGLAARLFSNISPLIETKLSLSCKKPVCVICNLRHFASSKGPLVTGVKLTSEESAPSKVPRIKPIYSGGVYTGPVVSVPDKMSLAPRVGKLGVVPNTEAYRRFQERQRSFCEDDGLLVWKKRPEDRIILWFTFGLITLCFGMTVQNLRRMLFRHKPRQELVY